MTAWRVVLRNPRTGDELALESWQTLQITENFDGATATIEVPGERPELSFVQELVTNVLFYSDRILAYQLRVMDAEDTFTTEAHTVSLTCQSYEAILARRILFAPYETKTGTPPASGAIDQHEIAWQLVDYTQKFEDIGIRKANNWAPAGKMQDRIIEGGKTIVEAINEAATVEDGFDWWIDQNLRLHAQTPRILFHTGLDWQWGTHLVSVTRSSASDSYSSVVYVTGAQSETTLPSGAVVPPPKPALVQLASRPYGRWEAYFSYGDLITDAAVLAKAKWHRDDSSKKRATYRLGVAPGIWNQTLRPGGTISIRIRSLPRLDFRTLVRIEELSISVDASGAETVELGTRSEDTETEITPTPQGDHGVVALEDPPGAITDDVIAPTGKSMTIARVSPVDGLAALLVDMRDRVSRAERAH